MSSSQQPPASLVQLPSELLRLVWDRLLDRQEDVDMQPSLVARVRDQHSLRCTCQQLRQATTSFLNALTVGFHYGGEGPIAWAHTLQSALRQLAAFPPAATLAALKWNYMESGDDDPSNHIELPELLPAFFAAARERLAHVTIVKLEGELVLTADALSNMVDACPMLRDLTVDYEPIRGPALAALTRLSGLQALRLCGVDLDEQDTSPQAASVYQPLALLSSLTELSAVTLGNSSSLFAEDALPLMRGLSLLRHLELSMGQRTPGGASAAMHHLSHLVQLTSLLVIFEGGCSLNSDLPLPPSLLHLTLRFAVLGTAAIQSIASLLRLSELTASELHPDRDLSGLACSYTKLRVWHSTSPLHLTHSPLRTVKSLRIPHITWTLDASDVPAASSLLGQACDILAETLGEGDDSYAFQLDWTSVPSSGTAPCLAALAPLAPLILDKRLCCPTLCHNWSLNGEHADQLATHLPNLSGLTVDGRGVGFPSFTAAVAVRMPQMTWLNIFDDESGLGELPHASQDALLALAVARACQGAPLSLYVPGLCMSREQQQRCQAVVELYMSAVGKTDARRVQFSWA